MIIAMLETVEPAAAPSPDKAAVAERLRMMELDQIALWVERLPDAKWERMLIDAWPALAKKCGLKRN
ncbi:hypothetical protein IDH44_07305 [Paenibacillus sp. IB182496]|uniref:Uncharacterized protein n=1 Tax=Paenibacillus sabuli TaxID=2772509 RepID=A0A927BQP7_9BACL|nr:hypothetical protein [Paenibacillus sabuli]MBD2844992.1 hypothetical protein [Paenibacillus sabuli]